MMKPLFMGAALLALAGMLAGLASAQSAYPVSGTWTYDNPSGDGPAKDCGQRYMTFQSPERFDTGGGVPNFRNVSVQDSGTDEYRIVDEFATGQIRARASYTLRILDDDHIVILAAGHTIRLRRCG
jgi:hypothetical protein